MNNMKKALALVMSLALAASTFVVGAAYDDVPDSHENRIAINLLGDLGVMVGDAGTNDFRPEGTLKRSEAAAIVYRLRTGKTNADSYVGTTGFSDVSDSHWASGYINYCVNQGIIAGYPDGTFKPDQDVTYAEYIKMVVCALNLQKVETTTYIDMNTGILVSEDKITTAYPTGYIALASDQQINEGIDYLNPNDKISRAEVAQGAYNAIFESYYKLDPKDADYVKDGTTYQHLAEQVFKLEKTTGIVTAYEDYTAINKKDNDGGVNHTGTSQSDNYFEVSFVNDKGNWDTDTFEYADFDPELVGQEVYVWEKQRNSSSATDVKVVAVVASENNTVSTINTNDLKKDGSDLYYTDVNGKKQTLKKADLTNTTLRLNGVNYNNNGGEASVWDMLTALAEKRVPVDLTFVDNDDTTKSPSVISIKVYGETEITSVSDDTLYIKEIKNTYDFNEIPDDKSGVRNDDSGRAVYVQLLQDIDGGNDIVIDLQAGSIDLLNDDDTVNSKVSYYDGIAKEDKVMIYADVNGVIDIRKIEEVSGTISSMSGSKFRVGDEEVYIVAGDGMKSQMTTNNGYDATAYIDPFTGYVINVDEGVGSVEDYYYLHLLSNTWENTNDFSVTAYDYEGNKVKLTFKDSTAEKSFEENCLGGTTLKQYLTGNPVEESNGSAVLDCIGILDVNSKGEIVRWRSNNVGDLETATYNKDNEYNAKTGYVNIDGNRVEVKPSSIVFGVDYAEDGDGNKVTSKIDDVKTYVGSFPSITSQTASVDYYLKNGDDDLKAALVRDKTKGGNTEFTNVIGYVVDERFEYNTEDDKGYAVYTIASKGEVKEYETEVADRTDLRDGSDSVKGKLIKYDLTTDDKILYGDDTDIEVMDGVVNDGENSFRSIVEDVSGVTTNGLTLNDFSGTGICPGTTNIDEDELYFGIVVESKDGKYIQLTDLAGNNIFVDYADDVKVHVLADGEDSGDKWDKVKGFDVGNIAISNENNTTYAAVRIVDGDDVNDARVTEVYAKTIKNDSTFKDIGELKAPSTPGDAGEGDQGSLDDVVDNITNEFTNSSLILNGGAGAGLPVPVGKMTLSDNTETLSLRANAVTRAIGDKISMNGVDYEIVNHEPKAANQIALHKIGTEEYGESFTGPCIVEVVVRGDDTNGLPANEDLKVPLTLAKTVEGQEAPVTKDFEVVVEVSDEALTEEEEKANNQKLVDAAVAKATDKTVEGFGDMETADVVVDKIAINDTANVTYSVDNEYVEASTDGTQILKKDGAPALEEDVTVEVTVNAVLGEGNTEAKAEGSFTLTLKAPEATQPGDDTTAETAANEFLEKGAGVVAADQTYKTVLSAESADAAMKLLSDTATSTAYSAAYATLSGEWTTLGQTEGAQDLVATAVGKTDAQAVSDFLGQIDAAIKALKAEEDAGTAAETAASEFLEKGAGVVAADQTYQTVLSAASADAAMKLLSDTATSAAYKTAFDALNGDWTALADTDGAQDAVATTLGKTNAADVTSFLSEIESAITTKAGEEADAFLETDGVASSKTYNNVLNASDAKTGMADLSDSTDAASYTSAFTTMKGKWNALGELAQDAAATKLTNRSTADNVNTYLGEMETAIGYVDAGTKLNKAINAIEAKFTEKDTTDFEGTTTFADVAVDGSEVETTQNFTAALKSDSGSFTSGVALNFSGVTDADFTLGTIEKTDSTDGNITIEVSDKTVTIKGTSTGNADGATIVIPVTVNEVEYTLTITLSGTLD